MTARRIGPAALFSTAIVFSAGCHRIKTPVSAIHMADLAAGGQLLGGFYGVEGNEVKGNGWRWAGPVFSLALAPPAATGHGVRLLLRLYFPETQIQKLGPTTLRAFVDGQALAPQTFTKGGSYEFARDVPDCFLNSNILPFVFSLSPYLPHSETDGRDLGAVVLAAGLEAK